MFKFKNLRDDSGAVLLHVAFAFIALMAFSAFVVDYGVFWESRRQAQNSADAAALSGAVALAYDDPGDAAGVASASAFQTSQDNLIWGVAPSVVAATDIHTPATGYTCPDDASNSCVRVDVYRTAARGNPLPIFFGLFVGLVNQDVKATATAKVQTANATDCLKPWAVIDKWEEHWPTPPKFFNVDPDFGPLSNFDKYDKKGDPDPTITSPDVYTPPTETDFGSGFHPYDAEGNLSPYDPATGLGGGYGLKFNLKVGSQTDFTFAAGWFSALALFDSRGGNDYRNNIEGCIGTVYSIGDELPIDTEPGEKVGPTKQAVESDANSLINQDKTAYWDPTMNGGLGGVHTDFPGGKSPRVVNIPVVNPDVMEDANKNGRASVPIANILGFFVDSWDDSSKSVTGHLVTSSGLMKAGTGGGTAGSFLRVITLIR